MDPLQERLLGAGERGSSGGINRTNGSRWRKDFYLIALTILLALCLAIYIYLNMQAISSAPTNPDSFKPLSRRKPMLDENSVFSDSGPSMIKLSDLLAHCIVALKVAGREVVNLSLAKNDKITDVGSKGKTLEGVDDVVTGADMKSHRTILTTIKDSYRRLRIVSEEDTTKEFEGLSAVKDILTIDRGLFANLLRSNLDEIENEQVDRGSMISQDETLVWIDPLDATKEYSENLTNYVTLMACIVHESTPVAGVIHKPFTNETFWSIMDAPTKNYHHSPDLKDALILSHNNNNTGDVNIIVSRSHAGDVKKVLEKVYGARANIISAGGSGYKTIELISGRADAYIHLTKIKKWDICAPHAILHSIPEGSLVDLSGDKILFGDPSAKEVTTGLVASLDKKLSRELIDSISAARRN